MPFPVYIPLNYDRTGLFHQGSTTDQLVILYSESEADLLNGYVIYRGGVKAQYGVTTLSTDTLIVRKGTVGDPPVEVQDGEKTYTLRPLEAYAIGEAKVVDPDGTIQAKNLWFTWDPARRADPKQEVGRGEDVDVHISNVWIRANKMSQTLEGFNFEKVGVSTDGWNHPLFKFDANSIFVEPGKRATAKSVRLTFLGAQLPPIPEFRFTLDPRANGVQIPRIGLRQGSGIGVSWGGDFLVNDSTDVATTINAYPKVQPTYSFAYGKSYVPVDQSGINQFKIYDQFGERSEFSFFGNIYTTGLDKAYDTMRIPKDLFSVGSYYNFETLGRITDRQTSYSRPIEVGYERGGPSGNWGYLVQAKAARILEEGAHAGNRLSLQGNFFSPLLRSGNLLAGTRFDGLARLDASSSGYVGGEGGISYQANSKLKLSAGAYAYKNFGTPLYQGDNFLTNQGFVVRGDLTGNATNISLMFRYDPTQGWFDREYRISQVIGPLEPVIVYRDSPRQYQLGFRFRTQDIARMLQRRKIERDKTSSSEEKTQEGSK